MDLALAFVTGVAGHRGRALAVPAVSARPEAVDLRDEGTTRVLLRSVGPTRAIAPAASLSSNLRDTRGSPRRPTMPRVTVPT